MNDQPLKIYQKGDGKPLFFIHGYLGSRAIWKPSITALSQHFRCISVDLPGFGDNVAMTTPASIGEFASILINTIKHHGLEGCSLIGHSMGGQIVQEMLSQQPSMFTKAILYGTGSRGAMPGRFETIDESRARLTKEGVMAMAQKISVTWFYEKEQSSDSRWVGALANDVSIETADNCLVAMSQWNCTARLADITIPVYILWGDSDKSYLWEEQQILQKNIPNVDCAIIAKAAHAAHLDAPQDFVELVRSWLRG